jgi:release factor glutamine methyltransferase
MNPEPRIDEVLGDATERLRDISETPRLDAELLLMRSIDVARSYLFAHPDDTLDAAAANRFRQLVEKRAAGMPLAYITGEKEFWSMQLIVSPDTLIPRPDTEILVEQALVHIPRNTEYRVLDLGTGSGAIALAIARERPLCNVVATDTSAAALRIAAENANQLGVPNVEFFQGDWFAPLAPDTFDLIVSNPPYIEANDRHLDDLRFEPARALIAGADGLDAIRTIAMDAGNHLRSGGTLLLEHGDTQAEHVAALLRAAGWGDVRVIRDLAGLPRVSIAAR